MDISVIIVNYNVRHFLEQCLYSVQAALAPVQGEILVIDNNSTDKSIDYLRPLFPAVRFLENDTNVGFARACNQGIRSSSGRYVLFLNPDTIIGEDSLQKCMAFMEERPGAGALGCRMVDGSGRFLPESKRSFPSPLTSLFKLFGFSRLFPKSPVFSRYHLGHLPENEDNEVDVLAGAFLFTRRKVLEEVGAFDERFFMYGEDVDLSYRIQQAGYKNFYFAGTTIIHFKGESTRKGSMNYVRMFYQAMSQFVSKHYGGSRAGLFSILIQIAIWLRAAFSAAAHFIRRIGLPMIDAALILLSFWLTKNIWESYVRRDVDYDLQSLWIAFPAYTVFYLVTAYYAGLYDRWYRISELVRATLIATLVLLAGYALLPEQYRFSRGIILFGSLLAFVMIGLLRFLLLQAGVLTSNREKWKPENIVIAGSAGEFDEIQQLLQASDREQKILGRVSVNGAEHSIGHIGDIDRLSRALPFREIVFCQGTLSFSRIIELVQRLPPHTKARIHARVSRSIVGSDSRDQLGHALALEQDFKLAEPYRRRTRRLLDVLVAVAGLVLFPLTLILVRKPLCFFRRCFQVLLGQKTWIGYASDGKNLPGIRPGIISCNGLPASRPQNLPKESLDMMDYWYARDYEPMQDLALIRRSYRRLGD